MEKNNLYSLDLNFKKIIKNKTLLSYIFHQFVDEYKDVDRKEIESLLQLKGITHKNGKDIIPLSGEVGSVRLDTVMGAYLPKQEEQIGIVLDIEMQRQGNSINQLYNRAEYYLSAVMVHQKDHIFENDNYQDIVRISGVWLCLHHGKHAINQYEVKENNKIGEMHVDKNVYDHKKIQFIYVGDEGEEESLEPLRILFFGEEGLDEKLRILKEEYGIDLYEEKKEVKEMCELAQLYQEIYEDKGLKRGMTMGMEKGLEKGTQSNIRALMESMNITFDEAARLLKIDANEMEKYRKLLMN